MNKCGSPLAEEWKKRKTFFSHTAGSMGSSVCVWVEEGSSGHVAFQSSAVLLFLLHGWLGMAPSCVWEEYINYLSGELKGLSG